MSDPKSRPKTPPKMKSEFSKGGGYGAVESFTAAYPRGQLMAELDDDDIDDFSGDSSPTGTPAGVEAPVPDPPTEPEVVASPRSSISWVYVVLAVFGGSILAVVAMLAAGLAWWLW